MLIDLMDKRVPWIKTLRQQLTFSTNLPDIEYTLTRATLATEGAILALSELDRAAIRANKAFSRWSPPPKRGQP